NIMAADNPSMMFASALYLIVHLQPGKVVWCNAGHPPPILMAEGRASYVNHDPGRSAGMVLGAMENMQYEDSSFTLNPGESLLLYTDGITEAVDLEGEMYGSDRLLQFAGTQPADAPTLLRDRLYETIIQYQQGQEQFDDITILLLSLRERK
ncbi:MAG: PP2C family protein-serine/threonine phosphatase, partial [Lentisphaerota bacterium]